MNSRPLLLKTALSFLALLFACNPAAHAQVKQAPYIEDFNSSPWVSYYAFSQNYANTNSVFDPSWSRSHGDTSNYHWQVLFGRQYINVNSGPKGGHPGFVGNYLAARRILGQTTTDTITFTTPKVDVSNLVNPYFSFYYHRHGSNNQPDLIVEVNDGSGWQQIYFSNIQTHFSNNEPYLNFGESLSAFGDTVEVRFSAVSNGCCYSIMAIDDISFIDKSSCPKIENLDISLQSDTSALVSWSPSASATGFIIYKKLLSQPIYHGANSLIIDTVSSNSILFDDLAINTCYQISVRPYCGTIDTGSVPNPVEVCTPEFRAYSMPFHNPLDDLTSINWNFNASNGFRITNSPGRKYLYVDPYLLITYNSTDSANTRSPFVYLDTEARVRFFWSRPAGSTGLDTMKVMIREIGETNWSTILIKSGSSFFDTTATSIYSPGDFVEEIIPIDSNIYKGKMVEVEIFYLVEKKLSPQLYIRDFIIEKPFETDLGIESANFVKNTDCFTGNDSISLIIFNNSDSLFDAQKNPLTVSIKFNGMPDSVQTRTINSGTIAPKNKENLWFEGISFPRNGVYSIVDVSLHPSAYNKSPINDYLKTGTDSIFVVKNLTIHPDSLVILTSTIDTAVFSALSNFFTGGDFVFSEICHYRSSLGEPTSGWPSYLVSDEYFELSGFPNSDLNGYSVEIWTDTLLDLSYTFTASSLLGSDGTATIGFTNNQNSNPSFNYFEIGPTFGSYFVFSYHPRGYILKNPMGTIVDAVGYSDTITPYIFPSAANVSSLQWSGHILSVTGSAGMRLEGNDQNNASNWTTVNLSSTQDPNIRNANLLINGTVTDTNFFWSFQGDTLSTDPKITVGPYQKSGYHNYVAHFSNYCGIFSDTATLLVNLPSIHCGAATNLNVKDASCTWADIIWSKNGSDSAIVEIGLPNFFPGLNQMNQLVGTTMDSLRIDQLEAGKTYDIWIRNFCGLDTSAWDGPISFTTPIGPGPIADFNISQIITGNSLDLKVDASTSSHGETFTWNYSNSTIGSGLLDSLTILNNGSFDITLIVENACGKDSLTKSVFVNIGIEETGTPSLQRIEVYPNPTKDILTIDLINLGEQKIVTAHFYNLQGKELINTEIAVDKAITQAKLNLALFPSGLYLLVIEGDKESWKKKVLVE